MRPASTWPLAGKKARSALYHNNHDGTFTDVTDKAGVGYPCWAMGAAVGDYNNDGWPDLLVTCFGGVVLYRNNGDGTFTDVTTRRPGSAATTRWATGAAFGDYDGDGLQDLFVSHYVDLDLNDLPAFGSQVNLPVSRHRRAVRTRGLKGSPDNLYHNNGDGTFTDVSKAAGVDDPASFFGLTAVWSDFDNDGKLDLFVANDGEPNYLYRNDGNGHFTDIGLRGRSRCQTRTASEQANMGVALGDYLHKGRFWDRHHPLQRSIPRALPQRWRPQLHRRLAALRHRPRHHARTSAGATRFFDLDNDGWLDLILVNGHVYPAGGRRGHRRHAYRQPKPTLSQSARRHLPRRERSRRSRPEGPAGRAAVWRWATCSTTATWRLSSRTSRESR